MNFQTVQPVIPLILLLLFIFAMIASVAWFLWLGHGELQRTQASKAINAQVDLHIARQKALGAKLIGEHDKPRLRELLVSLIAVGVVVVMFSPERWWL